MRVLRHTLGSALVAVAWAGALQSQQPRAISLEEALRLAESGSETMRIARAGVTRAEGQQLQARSEHLPQFAGTVNYSRTLATQFDALAPGPAPVPPAGTPPPPREDTTTYFTPCLRYMAAQGATEADRLRGLETYARCTSSASGGIDFSKVGFGSRNSYWFGLQGSLTLYSGGRVQAQNRAALAVRRGADIELAAQRALLSLTVTEAYYDAMLADRLVAIAESSLAQTTGVLRQTTLARQVGNQSEFELLRAQVTRDNQMPVLLERRTVRDLAYLRLRQLLNLPWEQAVRLTSDVEEGTESAVMRQVSADGPDTSASARSSVRQLGEALRAQEAQVVAARAERLPTITLSTQYAKLAFPRTLSPDFGNLLTNWTVSIGASIPLFTGGALRGGRMVAEAGAEETRARLEQTHELAALDSRQAVAQLQQAEAAVAASAGTSAQAARAYSIAEVRFREGISTQLELSESRLLLEQAGANRALAARNLQVARMRLVLLKDLPLGAGGQQGAGFTGGSAAGGATSGGATGGTGGGVAPAQRQGGARATQTASTTTGPGQGQ